MIFNLVGYGSSSGGGGDTPTPPDPPAPIEKTFILPEGGYWSSTTAGPSVQLALDVTQKYYSSTNRSELTIKFKVRTKEGGSWSGLAGTKNVLRDGQIKIDGTTVYSFSNSGTDTVYFSGEDNHDWRYIKSGQTGNDLVVTATKAHGSNGSATISIDIRLVIDPDYLDYRLIFQIDNFTYTLNDGLDVVEEGEYATI